MSEYFDLVFDIPRTSSRNFINAADQCFTYQIDEKREAAVGKRAMVSFGRREILGFIIGESDTLSDSVKNVKRIRRVVDSLPLFGPDDINTARWMAGYYLCSTGQAIAAIIPSGRKMIYPDIPDSDYEPEASLSISDEQAEALNAITSPGETSGQNSAQMFYIYGITGSGKTEVFLRAAQAMINNGKSVIYLVPEISLTHQTAKMIVNRFGSSAATLHSGLSPSVRLAEWIRIKNGQAPIVIGPRSAVFAPVPNLGLIIIDEEHDGSYKSGSTPRYHARQIALRRCSTEGAHLVMGSATPSVEAWKLMSEGAITRLNLTKRLSGGKIPEIKPVSLAKTDGCLTKELKDEIRITKDLGKQTILFLNRRGFGHFYQCPECLWEQICKNCSVSLTWHKSKGRCYCHYCGYSEEPPSVCPKCGCVNAGYRGFGTEMIEDEIKSTFPDLRISRVDADTTKKKGSLEETLTQFKKGTIDILLGTQMVAKGLNFQGVRLVGVVFADTGLHLPDFRAAERTFSLIVQVAGRAGRFLHDGKVIVQTLRMEDHVISRSCALDVDGFYKSELETRKSLGFPPYSRLIRFTIRAREEHRCEEAIRKLAQIARPLIPKDADLLGPAECPISIMNSNYRKQLILRGRTMSSLHAAARELVLRYEKIKDLKTYLEIDVDPISML